MSVLVVGLCDDLGRALGLARALEDTGIGRDTLSIHADPERALTALEELKGWQVLAEAEAQAYAEGVRRGGQLVTLRMDEALANRAIEVMDGYISASPGIRAAQWAQARWTRYEPHG
jgi:hypothetical protein